MTRSGILSAIKSAIAEHSTSESLSSCAARRTQPSPFRPVSPIPRLGRSAPVAGPSDPQTASRLQADRQTLRSPHKSRRAHQSPTNLFSSSSSFSPSHRFRPMTNLTTDFTGNKNARDANPVRGRLSNYSNRPIRQTHPNAYLSHASAVRHLLYDKRQPNRR